MELLQQGSTQVNGQISMSTQNLTVRQATMADYEAVLDIDRNVYGGLDYMENMFFPFLHSKQYIMFIAELHGKAVAFVQYRLDETDDEVIYNFSQRISPQLRGRGFYRVFMSGVKQQLATLLPRAKSEILITGKFPPNSQNKNQTILSELNTTVFFIQKDKLRTSLKESCYLTMGPSTSDCSTCCHLPHQLPFRLSYSNAIQLLVNTELLEQLFTRCVGGGRFVFGEPHGRPFKVDKRGLKELLSHSSEILVTVELKADDCDDGEASCQSPPSLRRSDISLPLCPDWSIIHAVKSASFSFINGSSARMTSELFIYCDAGSANSSTICGHVYGQALHAVDLCGAAGTIGLSMSVPTGTVDGEALRTGLDEFLGQPEFTHPHMARPYVTAVRPI